MLEAAAAGRGDEGAWPRRLRFPPAPARRCPISNQRLPGDSETSDEKVEGASNPRASGKASSGSALGNFWRWRVGDYRVVADIQDRTATVLVVRVEHPREGCR